MFDWTCPAHRAMDVSMTDQLRTAIDEAANALQIAVLLAAQLDTDHRELRRAIDRAARALASLKPKPKERL
jgi:hypothetical protein